MKKLFLLYSDNSAKIIKLIQLLIPKYKHKNHLMILFVISIFNCNTAISQSRNQDIGQ